jgi:hypothetical protein
VAVFDEVAKESSIEIDDKESSNNEGHHVMRIE